MNFGNLRNFRSLLRIRRERLGIDVEVGSVRVVRLGRSSGDLFEVEAYGSLDMDLRKAGGMDQQRFLAAIRQLGEGTRRVAVNVEHPSLRIRRMLLPRMPEGDMLEAIRWNFKEHIDVPVEKFAVDYIALESFSEGNKQVVMAYGVSEEAIAGNIKLMKSMGLRAVWIEPSATALLAVFKANGILADGGGYHVCILFEEVQSQFIVMKDHDVIFSRPMVGISEGNVLKSMMQDLDMDRGTAWKNLSDWMATGTMGPDARRFDVSMEHFLSRFVVEAERSVDAFCIMYGVDRVDRIHICGIGAWFPGLVSHVQKSLGIPTEVLNPFVKLMDSNRQTDEVVRQAPLYAVAVGLALP